ncbi:MAG: HEPN domain-containing protein [Archaeoglobus sp.]|nr:HEPN domain-containing protein [Archaeoglobus sp.]
MKEEVEMLRGRASKFERDAKFDFDHSDFDLAMFHIEQAFQLNLKAKLLDLEGFFDRTHSLRKLLEHLIKIDFKSEELKSFIARYRYVLRNLERAYITSRYLYDEFFEEEVAESFRALDDLKKLLWG